MSEQSRAAEGARASHRTERGRGGDGNDAGARLLALYDSALPQVYGYLLSRSGQRQLAEDLTAETFLAAVDAFRANAPVSMGAAWLIGVARHKLTDHWRRQAREERTLRAAWQEARTAGPATAEAEDPWNERLDALRAREVLQRLGPHHRAALTLRYMDDLPVADVAGLLGRTVHATEALLVRARSAFRAAYTNGGEEEGDV